MARLQLGSSYYGVSRSKRCDLQLQKTHIIENIYIFFFWLFFIKSQFGGAGAPQHQVPLKGGVASEGC